ncbi:hypothetical protein, partial [Aerococcus loyolae]
MIMKKRTTFHMLSTAGLLHRPAASTNSWGTLSNPRRAATLLGIFELCAPGAHRGAALNDVLD